MISGVTLEAEKRVSLNSQTVLRIKPRALKVLCQLMSWPMGFNQLKSIAQTHPTIIARDLQLLIKHGLVARKVINPKLRQVEYSLTEKGKNIIPSLLDIVRRKNYV